MATCGPVASRRVKWRLQEAGSLLKFRSSKRTAVRFFYNRHAAWQVVGRGPTRGRLLLDAPVDHGDAHRQSLDGDLLETGIFDHLHHLFALEKSIDALR